MNNKVRNGIIFLVIVSLYGGFLLIDAAIRVAKRRKNVYIDTASVQLSTLKKALKEIDPNKILMGTDAPWGDFTLSIDLVKKATDDIEIQNKILGENIVRVLNWKK